MEDGGGRGGGSGKTDGEKLVPNPRARQLLYYLPLRFWLSRRYTLKLLAETCVQRCCKTERVQFHEVVLHGETLVFFTTATVASRR